MVREDKNNKSKASFIQFNIIDFYPSISKKILIDSINNAKEYINITGEQYDIILACRKTVLGNNGTTWIKSGPMNFDIPMGDLVGLYILHILNRIINSDHIGLYRMMG